MKTYIIHGQVGEVPFSRCIDANSPQKALKILFPHAKFALGKKPPYWVKNRHDIYVKSWNKNGDMSEHVYKLVNGGLLPNAILSANSSSKILRIEDILYSKDFTGYVHETLNILNCIDNNFEDTSTQKQYTVKRLYRCQCHLCGKIYYFTSDKLKVQPPTDFGFQAYHGYWSPAFCKCHEISSFQWTMVDILERYSVPYKAEAMFEGLMGSSGNPLRFDFAIYNKQDEIKALIECQGEQHYESIDDLGGYKAFKRQQKCDSIKRQFCMEIGIPLIEIPRRPRNLYNYVERELHNIGIIQIEREAKSSDSN